MSRVAAGGLLLSVLAILGTGSALAHGPADARLTVGSLLSSWSDDPLTWLGVLAGTAGYLGTVGFVNRRHPKSPVPHWRVVAWLAGMLALAIALDSGIDAYADDLLSIHMVQHMLLVVVVPPLLALGAPVTLALRAAGPSLRRQYLLPILHSRFARILSAPALAWIVFTVVLAGSHFSPLFNAALEDPAIHFAEHLVYLGAGLLFWWPAVGADPSPRRFGYAGRVIYLGSQMPVHAATGLAIYFSPTVLYPHYRNLERAWGPTALADQQIAGALMWGAGDIILVVAIVLTFQAWLRAHERRARRLDRRASVQSGP